MPPRLSLQCLRAPQVPSASPACRSFSSSSAANASTVTQRRRHHDPYAMAQAKARKAANLSRQEVLKKERAVTLGDPVRGRSTPFVESFDNPNDASAREPSSTNLNFYLSRDELEQGLEKSRYLTTPPDSTFRGSVDNFTRKTTSAQRLAAGTAKVNAEQSTAAEALRRIAALSVGSSKDRLRLNTARCIDTFGRHNTDQTLPPRPRPTVEGSEKQPIAMPRVGADTGSSEVQIAILTAKIRTLSEYLGTRGRTDKANKRNLRLLVHRRQKLLQYLRRKERGGPRWQNLVETLGLTEGTWKGEISM